jgi:UMF1 family MFS transporter
MPDQRQDVGGNLAPQAGGKRRTPLPNRKEVFAWAMYDWANSAYSTLSITVLLLYIQGPVFPEEVWGDTGFVVWGFGIGISMVIAAALSPIVGAIADAHASKRRWLAGTALPGALASSLLFFVPPSYPWIVTALFFLASLFFELSLGVYNGFLPEIARDEDMDRVSAWGFAMGYLGGGLALALVIVMFFFGDKIGLPPEGESAFRTRLGLLLMGLWWGFFTLPTLAVVRDKRSATRSPKPLGRAAKQALREVGGTIRNVRRYRMLALFLLGFLIYNEGVQTMISQSGTFAKRVLKMEPQDLVMVVLMIQFIALPGAILVGHLATRFGQKSTLIGCLLVWIAILVAAYYITTTLQFWIMAAVAALVLGGTQSVSRSIMGQMTPEKHTAEFFGFFNLSGKATSMFGPIFFTSILALTGDANLAVTSLLVFFVAGLAIVTRLNLALGKEQARAAD